MRQGDDVGPPLRTAFHGWPGEIEVLLVLRPVNAAPVGTDPNGGPAAEGDNLDCSGVFFPLGGTPDCHETLVCRYGFEMDDGIRQKLLALRAVIVHAVKIIN